MVTDRDRSVVVWVAVIAIFGALRPDSFLTASNFQTIFASQAALLVSSRRYSFKSGHSLRSRGSMVGSRNGAIVGITPILSSP